MKNLGKIRKELDLIDDKIAKLLQKRMKFIIEVKKIKEDQGLKVMDPQREKDILQKRETKFEKEVFKKILLESRKLQKTPKAPLQKEHKT